MGWLCLLAFALRLAAFVALDRVHRPDIWESERVATALLEGRGFTYRFHGTTEYRSFMEPLYPGLCALVYAITRHSFLALGLVQAALGSLLVWLVFACAKRMSAPSVATLAAGLTACHPGLVLYATKFHPLALDVVLFAAVLMSCLAFSPQRPWRSSLILGFLIGLCLLARPTIIACGPVIAWWVWRRSSGSARIRLAELLVILACSALVISPWQWRNYQISGRVLLTRSGSALVFWLGNNPYRFTGSAVTPEGQSLFEVAPRQVRETLQSLDEFGQQAYLMDEAMRYVRAHPLLFLQRWALKYWYFWWYSPQAGMSYPRGWFRGYQGVSALILGLAMLGAWTAQRNLTFNPARRGSVFLVLGFVGSIGLLQSLYYVEGRHRLAAEPLLLILTAQGIRRVAPQLGVRHARTA